VASELTAVRAEDAFDVVAVDLWLRGQISLPEGLPEVEQFRRGASNLTYLLRYSDRDLVLRRPPHGRKAASAHDMHREVLIQSHLKPQYPYVPTVIAECTDPAVIGSDFYVMERLVGTILRRDVPENVSLDQAKAQQLSEAVIVGLSQLHHLDPQDLMALGKGEGYVARQVDGWSRRYRAARTPDVPEGEQLMTWLHQHQPGDVASVVIHGDWRLDNMVFDLSEDPRLIGVLDWELSTIGDPLMDLGSAMAYWINADDEPGFASLRRQPSHIPGMVTREEFISRYLAHSRFETDDFSFYEIFGLFRLAVICQQIWARYVAGETTNPAFADFGTGVKILIDRAEARMS
jgi:aminoglycoside phosphotransferase (APT) family kinase protein